METYKSSINVLNDNFKQLSQSKQVGEFIFKMEPNTSGKSIIKFQTPYAKRPLLNVVVSCDSGSEFEMRHTIAKFDCTGFELHVINTDMTNQLQGSVQWLAQPCI